MTATSGVRVRALMVIVLGTKPIFKRKTDIDGKIEKYKARLVAQGFRHVKHLHYTDSYSSIPTPASVRILLAIEAAQDLKLGQLNFERAFHQADVGETIYVELPRKLLSVSECRWEAQQGIYGLNQAERWWNTKLTINLQGIGLEQSHADPCVFRRISDDGKTEILVAVAARDAATLEGFVVELHGKFVIKDLVDANFYIMRCHFTRSQPSSISISTSRMWWNGMRLLRRQKEGGLTSRINGI